MGGFGVKIMVRNYLFFRLCMMIILELLFCFVIILFHVSLFLILFQSLVFNFLFFGLFYFFSSRYKFRFEKRRGVLNVGFKRFILFYLVYENYSELFFLFSYFLGLDSVFEILLLFKQGLFPFLIYGLFLSRICLRYFFLRVYFVVFIGVGKIWGVIVLSKVIVCVDFYFFYGILTSIYLIIDFKRSLGGFLSRGIVLNNLFLFVMSSSFSFYVVFFYSVLLFYLYFRIFKSLGLFEVEVDGYYYLYGRGFRFLGVLILTLLNGSPFLFSSFLKVFSLVVLCQFSFCGFLFFCGVISYYLCFSILFYIRVIGYRVLELEVIFCLCFVWVVVGMVLFRSFYGYIYQECLILIL